MSTRGFISFVVDGETKTTYNHSDSYPSWLGVNVLTWARSTNLFAAMESARALRVVDASSEPTDDDVAVLADFHDPNVGGRSARPTWYQLLRRTQGYPGAILAAGVMEDASNFPADSLWAEYGYVVDFDAQALEVYVGFQGRPHSEGRFASMQPRENDYHPVRLAVSWPLSKLPSDAEFADAIEAAEAARAAESDVAAAVDMAEASSGFSLPPGWCLEFHQPGVSGNPGWHLYGKPCPDGDWMGTSDAVLAQARAIESIAAYDDAARAAEGGESRG